MQTEPHSEIQFIKGVGPRRAQLLESELNIRTAGDLIRLYPYKYIDRSNILPIAGIQPGNAFVQIRAQVVSSALLDKTGKSIDPSQAKFNAVSRLSVVVSDGSGSIDLVFFKGIKYVYSKLTVGSVFIFFGKPSLFGNRLNMVHPEIDDPGQDSIPGGTMTGVYPSTEKLKNAGITGKVMNRIMASALKMAGNSIQETLPEYVLKEKGLVPLAFALTNIHFPKDINSLKKAEYRLKFEELFLLQLSLLKQKYIRSRNAKGLMMNKVGDAFNICYKSLPYDLTGAQKRVIKEIRADMMSGKQMNRLLQGDVGSGKTMVAVLSALIAYGNGYQSCIMAPTEVLARQHYKNMCKYLERTGVNVAVLTGTTKTAERRTILEDLASGKTGIIVGTHALIEDNVVFRNLGLAIIDEQHRFGVRQREALTTRGNPPHVLVMSATPIPRTLAIILYGDLDISIIDELPAQRLPIKNCVVGTSYRPKAYSCIEKQIHMGRQAYVICPMVEESEGLDAENVTDYAVKLREALPDDICVEILHGKMKPKEKNRIMEAFASGEIQVLVSTTVVEVGVNVPNATVMMVENAERFGLAQLHQLRGRVGRGEFQSYCIFIQGNNEEDTSKRLKILNESNDGFYIAGEDLKLRGPGDLFGIRQSGLMEFKIGDIYNDAGILKNASEAAGEILALDFDLRLPQHKALKERLMGYMSEDLENLGI